MVKYTLINPYIDGDFESTMSGGSSLDVAKKMWESLSTNFSANVPKTAFTLMNEKNNKLYHFSVTETLNGSNNNAANFDISAIDLGISDKEINNFTNQINKINTQQGGARHKKRYKKDDSSSSSSDSSVDSSLYNAIKHVKKDTYRSYNYPISYWWYNPIIYRNLDKLYIPIIRYPTYAALSIGDWNSSFLS
jgi:hypothetical protein